MPTAKAEGVLTENILLYLRNFEIYPIRYHRSETIDVQTALYRKIAMYKIVE